MEMVNFPIWQNYLWQSFRSGKFTSGNLTYGKLRNTPFPLAPILLRWSPIWKRYFHRSEIVVPSGQQEICVTLRCRYDDPRCYHDDPRCYHDDPRCYHDDPRCYYDMFYIGDHRGGCKKFWTCSKPPRWSPMPLRWSPIAFRPRWSPMVLRLYYDGTTMIPDDARWSPILLRF